MPDLSAARLDEIEAAATSWHDAVLYRSDSDAKFIGDACTSILDLIAELRRTEGDLAVARAQVDAVEGLLRLLARVSPSPKMTVEVGLLRECLDTGHVPDLTAGKKVGQAAV